MIVLGFFFAAVSGNLVGMIGSSNNPVSGLTLCTLVVAALLMVAMGLRGNAGIAAVLGVAAVVCVSSAVAGEMLQDLKAGHILGGTPAKMQIGDLLGIAASSMALFFPLMWLHRAYTFGTPQLPAPQAGLMASLAQGIVGGNMAWPLVVVGILMGFGLILVRGEEPHAVLRGHVPAAGDHVRHLRRRHLPLGDRQVPRQGQLQRRAEGPHRERRRADGLGLDRGRGAVRTGGGRLPRGGEELGPQDPAGLDLGWNGLAGRSLVLVGLAVLMIRLPLANAGRPDEPAPPTAIM